MTTPEYLRSIGACQAAIDQVGKRLLRNAVQESQRADWLFWLASKNAGIEGWPTRLEILHALGHCFSALKVAPHLAIGRNLDDALDIDRNAFVAVIQDAVKFAASIDGIFNLGRSARMCQVMRSDLSFLFLEKLDQ